MPDKVHLLIVDDERDFLDSAAERLESRGFDVTKAPNAEDALRVAEQGLFDLVLLDLRMPGMDGKELLKALKREHRFLEVIILTGHGSIDSAVDCTKLGAFSYLTKPCDLDQLLEVLKHAYEARLRKKFEFDDERFREIERIAERWKPETLLRDARRQMASKPSFIRSVFRELRKLDDDVK